MLVEYRLSYLKFQTAWLYMVETVRCTVVDSQPFKPSVTMNHFVYKVLDISQAINQL